MTCPAKLHIMVSNQPQEFGLAVSPGQPLGATLIGSGNDRMDVGLPGFLRRNNCASVVDRFLCPVASDPCAADAVREALCDHSTVRLVGESAWIELPGEINGETVRIFMLSREQRAQTQGHILPPEVLHLCNGQLVDAGYLDKPYRQIPLAWAEGSPGLTADGIEYFQTIDSSKFSRALASPHSYYVILNTHTAQTHDTGWVKVSNHLTAPGFREDSTPSFAVQTIFSDRVGVREVALDETVSVAIGMREGELVHVESIEPKIGTLRRQAFSFRHSVVRVIGATTMDMEKPVVRLPVGVLDILGVTSGSRVVIEALSRGDDRIRKASVRVLEERDQGDTRVGGLFDVLDITGSVDLPSIAMDLTMRKRLGIHRGDPIYVRPEFGSVLFEEITTVTFALLAVAVGAYAASEHLLATIFAALYVILSAVGLWRKFR